ncbi:MAG: hypothetical protein KAQ75_06625, partial [Bacteroidales bacterium]|nr:hypothetical protein [Bacteroidales bacterium]
TKILFILKIWNLINKKHKPKMPVCRQAGLRYWGRPNYVSLNLREQGWEIIIFNRNKVFAKKTVL